MTDAATTSADAIPPDPPGAPGRPRVAVIFGGASSEHSISCLTAASVVRAIDAERYDVLGIGITGSGRWVRVPAEQVEQFAIVDGALPELSEDAPDALVLRNGSSTEVATRTDQQLAEFGGIDVAFTLLHGPYGEDGTIQGLFEMMGVRYVGAGVLASAVGMDKHFTKLVLAATGIPIAPYTVITPGQWRRDPAACLDAAAALTYPVFVKPARGGSSLGISKVDRPDGLADAIALAQRHDPKVLVEQGITNARELECGVIGGLGDAPPQASPVAEITMQSESGFYDFEAKYLPEEQVVLDVPADLPGEVQAEIQELAVRTFEALDCEGLARVDVFLTDNGRVVLNEINTMPGFTQHSMFPRMWAEGGVPYPELIDRLLTLALERSLGLR
ncbi:MAG: D-alanine--D-alanine ligase family protein [Propionibacteriaceae bacterium]